MMKAALKEEQYLIFRVGLVACCVSIETIDSVVRAQFGKLHQLPNQANYISGVLQYRDNIISIVNLFHKFAQSLPVDEPGDYIIAHTKFGLAGFWVNEVLDIVDTSEESWSEAPLYLGDNIFQKTMMWQDKLILQSKFDHLIAMNDSGRINSWATQNRPDLFEQDAANSVFDEDEHAEAGKHTVLEESVVIDDVISVIEPVSVIGHDIVTDNRLDDERENELSVIKSISAQNSDVEPSAKESKLADPETPALSTEIPSSHSVIARGVDITKIADEDKADNTFTKNSNNETFIVPGFTRFMEESSILSDFEDSSEIIELSAHRATAHSEAVTIDKTDLVSEFARSPTEILSIHSTFDETHILDSDFIEVESLVIDALESSVVETEVEQEIQESAINETVIFEPIEEMEPIENSKGSTSYKAVESEQRLENTFTHSERPALKSDSDLSSVIDGYILDAEKSSLDAATKEKREASIRKIINRIEENNPQPDGKNKVRLVASVLVAASAVFFIQHYIAEDKNIVASAPNSIELLRDNTLGRTAVNSIGLIGVETHEDMPVIAEVEGLLPILPIPLTNTAKIQKGESPVFPWRTHSVGEGDTLWDLSAHYLNNPFRYPELARWSNIENPDLIYPGDKVKYQDEFNVEVQSYKKIVKFR